MTQESTGTLVYYDIPSCGYVRCTLRDGALVRVILGTSAPLDAHGNTQLQREHRVLSAWIHRYCHAEPQVLPPIRLVGTTFQRAVWNAIATIPYGETRTYTWIATQIGNIRAVRAVGNACGANPCPLIIPCHRVVAAEGPGGFSGPTEWKAFLQAFERRARQRSAA